MNPSSMRKLLSSVPAGLAALTLLAACSSHQATTGATPPTSSALPPVVSVTPPPVSTPEPVASATAAPLPSGSGDVAAPPSGDKPLKVFFMGNSLTLMNSLPKMVAALAAKETPPVVVGQNADPQESLAQHLKRDGLKWEKRRWNVFVLQDRSNLPLDDKPAMLAAMKGLDDQVKEGGTGKTLLFETWAAKSTLFTDQPKVKAAFDEAQKLLGAKVAPVGDAFVLVLKKAPSTVLYDADGKHAAVRGTYLAACVFYSVLYSKSPAGLPGPEGAQLDAKELALLQQSAWATVHPAP